jgi:hypothetical protein
LRRTLEDLGNEIERRWTQLGAPPVDGGVKVLDLPQDVASGRLLLGIATDGSRLLVPLESDVHRSFKTDTQSRGVQLLLRQLEQATGNRWYLDVVCLREELRWLFSSFIADVLLRFERHPDVAPQTIVKTCFTAWRALFAGGRRMTIKQLAGLYGELHILERLLRQSPDALERWRGPLGDPHDFVSPGIDLEVKTTLSSEDEIVHIHGLDQLAQPPGGQLHLVYLRVETPSEDGDSLGAIIHRITNTDRQEKLPGLLSAAGLDASEQDAHRDLTFGLTSERWYEVDPSFPRLTRDTFPRGDVPDGLADFRYTLDLSSVPVVPLSTDEVDDALQRLGT